jgi:hypothetical protein
MSEGITQTVPQVKKERKKRAKKPRLPLPTCLDPTKKFYSNDEACSIMGRSRTGLFNDRKRGLLIAHQFGSRVFFSLEDLQTYIEQARGQPIRPKKSTESISS